MSWELDGRLAADTVLVSDSSAFQLRLLNDHRYEWLILVPKIANVTELFELPSLHQQQLLQICNSASEKLLGERHCDKVNAGYLGNVVAQFHFHIVGRRMDDPAWPGPVWGHSARESASEEVIAERCEYWRALRLV